MKVVRLTKWGATHVVHEGRNVTVCGLKVGKELAPRRRLCVDCRKALDAEEERLVQEQIYGAFTQPEHGS